MKKWSCTVCGYVYQPEQGDPDNGVRAGTAFEELPDGWVCPVCGVGKELFEPVDEETGEEAGEESGDKIGKEAPAGRDRKPGGAVDVPVGQKDPKAMQSAVFKISYGLFIVTSLKGDKINGQCANTVFQITSDPVRIAFGINKANLTHEYITASGVAGVTVLGEDGHDLVRRFGYSSGRDKDKFAGVEYVRGNTGVPIVKGGIAFLELKVLPDKSIDLGTHTLFVADLVDGAVVEDREPMTYAYFRRTK